MNYDRIILGAGLYGLYSALYCAKNNRDENILILEYESEAFSRATYMNQARVHQGYHYPRSYSTAIKSAHYFERFCEDYGFCILSEFRQIYATAKDFSWTNSLQFKKFCQDAKIPCERLIPDNFFNPGMCDGAFFTKEYTYDAQILRNYFLHEIEKYPNVKIIYNFQYKKIFRHNDTYVISGNDNHEYDTSFLLNATYASTNQIINELGFDMFKIKYELCEIILCDVNDCLKNIGFTVMDGPFFSIMPFGKTGLHSLTSVTFTPHSTSYENMPTFECQHETDAYCSPEHLGNCNLCSRRPDTAWVYMSNMAKKYLKKKFEFYYRESLFSMKPILVNSEVDDSRPTVIKCFSQKPTFISVLSGKINTVYDLDEVLKNG